MHGMTGLIITGSGDTGTQQAARQVALSGIAIDVVVEETAAAVTIVQTYKNREAQPVEAVYCFPVEESAAICGFEIITGGRRITGKVEEREKAFEIYDNALAQGNASYLLDQELQDVLYLSVGNIKPDQEVAVMIRYVNELPVIDGVIRLQIPATVSPRYSPAESDPLLVDRITPPLAGQVPYALSFRVKVISAAFTAFTSLSHLIKTATHEEYTYITLQEEVTSLDRDFILELTAAAQKEPLAVLGTHENGDTAVLLRFAPQFEQLAAGQDAQCEVIFLLDCSGSMSGSSIAEAKAALELSIRSLNEGDLFNIILFGSSYEMVSRQPLVYNTSTFQTTLKYIARIDANLGGTELAGVMSYICSLPPSRCRIRDLILLTDGEVSNPDAVIGMVPVAAHAPLKSRRTLFSGFSNLGGMARDSFQKSCGKKTGGFDSAPAAAPPAEWYIRLLQTQQPEGYFNGLAVALEKSGITTTGFAVILRKTGIRDTELSEKLLVTVLAVKLLSADREAGPLSRRAVGKAEKWIAKILGQAALTREAVENLFLADGKL